MAIWPFTARRLIDEETAAWHLGCFAWLIEEFGGDGEFARARLVLPRAADFPTAGEEGHALAERIFKQVRAYCGMGDWPVTLVVDDNPLSLSSRDVGSHGIASEKHAVGLFMPEPGEVVIAYVPSLLDDPPQLIATLAHELAHYLLASAQSAPPCEAEEVEFLTDLTAVFLGFGVFLANARFNQEVVTFGAMEGVGWHRTGYLPEHDLIFALAIFLAVKRLDANAALKHLKPHLRSQLGRAQRQLANEAAIDELHRMAATT